jgi:hypothetical protein
MDVKKRDTAKSILKDLAKEWTTNQYAAAYSDAGDCHTVMTQLILRARRLLRQTSAKNRR